MADLKEKSSAVGHSFQVEQLWHLARSGRIPQALLLSGPTGVGKRRIAFDLAAEILAAGSDRPLDGERRTVWSGNHPDLHVLHREAEKKDISVDQVREFCSSMRLKPYQGTTSVWIIDNSEEMNIAASNSLLMPLEEPPAHAKIILITDSIHRIVPTIVSRCQPVFFGLLAATEIARIISGFFTEAEVEPDQRLIGELVSYCGGTLAPLAPAGFLSQQNGRIADAAGLVEHLKQILAQTRAIRGKVEGALKSQTPTAHLISVAAELAGEKEGSELTWGVLRQIARERITAGSAERIGRWAEALEAAVKSEQLIGERNLSPQLHLADLLLKFGDAHSA